MSEYKGIKGFQVQTRIEDPENPIIGDFFYSSSAGRFKNVANGSGSGVWATGGSMNTARYRMQGGMGTYAAAVAVAGATPNKSNVESYDGTSWTEVTDYPASKLGIGAAGTQTAAIVFGGSPTIANSFTYDGSSYSAVSALNTGRFYVTSSGATETDAMAMGGDTGSVTGATETWDGVSWTEQADLSVARGRGANHFQTATQSASLVAAGNNASNARVATTEEWTGPGTAQTRTFTDS